jgi:hypothetical protein
VTQTEGDSQVRRTATVFRRLITDILASSVVFLLIAGTAVLISFLSKYAVSANSRLPVMFLDASEGIILAADFVLFISLLIKTARGIYRSFREEVGAQEVPSNE